MSNTQSGSSSIRKLPDPYSDIKSSAEKPYRHHVNARTLKLHFEEMGWDWSSYFKFTTVRNPWDRMVGRYHYGLKNRNSVWHDPAMRAGSFPQFLADPYVSRVSPKSSGLKTFAYSQDGECLVDRILKLEDITTTLPQLLRELDIPVRSIPHENRTRHRHYSTYYDEVNRELVRGWFLVDIEVGGYVFEQQSVE